MLDHVGLKTQNLAALVRFYDAVLPPLGYLKIFVNDEGAAFGVGGLPELWIVQIETGAGGANIAFRSEDRESVDHFFDNALAAGAISIGSPMLRSEFHDNHYAAFVVDPDGNNLSAVCHDNVAATENRPQALAS
ncbi:VOC family protein [Rhizobium sp. S152]|uniref:VOC family protein n=1 Tax=Rhizobium sp. S152 TaxID=3055038 RepID=UPI0025A9F8C7|nr:VOC family protein [Rhizobium sp. S152]MDM9628483.1 VOC family protein [Rhizobium sp. S152]